MKNHCIPNLEFPGVPCGMQVLAEPLVDIADFHDNRIYVSMEYYRRGLPGAIPRCLLRRSAAEQLKKALELLPSGYGFRIYDAWRPIQVQQSLFDHYYHILKEQEDMRLLSEEELLNRVCLFVSRPSYDPLNPSVHSTGGAVDLTIVDEQGRELPMGTGFDDFVEAAQTTYFETHAGTVFRNNRRLLYHCMTAAGFTNLSSEWWHYDYGTCFWSYYTGKPAMYTGILNEG